MMNNSSISGVDFVRHSFFMPCCNMNQKGGIKMPVVLKKNRKTLVAAIKGDIDHHSAAELREAIDEALADNADADMLVLDFGEVTFMDSSGVGLVMGRYRLAETLKKKVRVENLDERDYRIMKMSGIEKIAEINMK